jgi:hypothetical protein
VSDGGLPAYVERPGEQVYGPPYVAHCRRLYLFFVDADVDKLNQLLDEGLNAPLQAHYGVSPAFQASRQSIMFMFADIPRMYSDAKAYMKGVKDPRNRDRELTTDEITELDNTLSGDFVREVELSVWVPLVRTIHGQNTPGYYLPFVFNDSPASVATGREVYGYPKQWAEIDFDLDAAPPHTIDLSTWHIPPAPAGESEGSAEYKQHPLLHIDLPTAENQPGIEVYEPAGPVKEALARAWRKPPETGRPRLRFAEVPSDGPQVEPDRSARPGMSDPEKFAQDMVRSAPLYFLRQFRDPVDPRGATDQRLIEAMFVIQRTPMTKRIVGNGSITFKPSRTLNLPKVLGLDPKSPTPILESLVIEDLTFTVDLGKDLLA